jgi:cytochrome b subunit of formate dehydrogenase
VREEQVTASLARPLLHAVHVVTFTVLLATGLLLFLPGLRAEVVGGYSLVIRQAHRWGGVAFMVLPLLVVVRFGARSVFVAPSQRTLRTLWQGMHVAVTLGMGGVFTFTGFVIWGKRLLPELIVESSRLTHDWLTYAAAVLVMVHLVEVGLAALLARIKPAAAAGAHQSEM